MLLPVHGAATLLPGLADVYAGDEQVGTVDLDRGA
jgi:hypothetical protein